MIRIISGMPGGGKSYYVARELDKRLRGDPTIVVGTGIDMKPEWWRKWRKPECERCPALDDGPIRPDHPALRLPCRCRARLVRALDMYRFWEMTPPGSFLALDEAGIYFNSRMYAQTAKKSPHFFEYLAQHRHYRDEHGRSDEIWFIAQQMEHVDKQIRGLCQTVTHCVAANSVWRALGLPSGLADRLNFFFIRHYLVGGAGLTPLDWQLLMPDKRIFGIYDSYSKDLCVNLTRSA